MAFLTSKCFKKENKMGKCDRNNKENLILESAHIKTNHLSKYKTK